MYFTLHRKRTIASTCGLSIEFEKGERKLVSPLMYAEVLAVGGVPDDELPEEELKAKSPEGVVAREKALNEAFAAMVKRNESADFTAGGVPSTDALHKALDFTVTAKERDAAWLKFTQAGSGK